MTATDTSFESPLATASLVQDATSLSREIHSLVKKVDFVSLHDAKRLVQVMLKEQEVQQQHPILRWRTTSRPRLSLRSAFPLITVDEDLCMVLAAVSYHGSLRGACAVMIKGKISPASTTSQQQQYYAESVDLRTISVEEVLKPACAKLRSLAS